MSPYPPSRDGIGDYTSSLAAAIQKAGNEICVVIPYDAGNLPSEVIGSLSLTGRMTGQLKKEITAWEPEIVHVQFAIAAFGTRTIALLRWLASMRRCLDVPIVVTLHELNREHAILGPVGYFIHKQIIKRCDQLIVHSAKGLARPESSIMASAPGVAVIQHPTAPRRTSVASERELRARFSLGDSRTLLAFGFIHIDKGLEDLISALSMVRQERPDLLSDLRLVIAGDIRPRHGLFRAFEVRDWLYRIRLVRQIKRSNLQGHVVMTGYVPHEEVPAWFGLAEAAVLSYRRAEHSGVESLARAFGVPVLTSTAGGLAEQAAGSRWTFPPRSPSRIAETITEFLLAAPAQSEDTKEISDPADLSTVTANTLDLYAAVRRRTGPGDAHATRA